MLDSAKIGLRYLKDRCDKVLFCPVDIPFFTDETVEKVLSRKAGIVILRCAGKGGHPIVIDSALIPSILTYRGEEGLRGALKATGVPVQYVDVEDPGSTDGCRYQRRLRETGTAVSRKAGEVDLSAGTGKTV